MNLALWRWRLALALAALDGLWSVTALAPAPGPNQAATVQLTGLTVWIYLHLPAALLAGWFFGDSPGLPLAERGLLGALGALQAALLGWLAGWILDRNKKARA